MGRSALKKLQNYVGLIQHYQQTLELCSIEKCQCYICVTLNFCAKLPLAQKEILVEVISPSVMLEIVL